MNSGPDIEQEPLLSDEHSLADPDEVLVHVYDITPWNGYVHWTGLGAYHTGVELFGKEYCYGWSDDDDTGVYRTKPLAATEWAQYRETIRLGRLRMPKPQAKTIIRQVAARYIAKDYNILTKNCNHFTFELCEELVQRRPPEWINRLAFFGSQVECCLPASLKEMRVSGEEEPPPSADAERPAPPSTTTDSVCSYGISNTSASMANHVVFDAHSVASSVDKDKDETASSKSSLRIPSTVDESHVVN